MPSLNTKDGHLVYTDHSSTGPADAPALLLLHGWCCSRDDWDPVLPELITVGRVITVDQRGAGHSSSTPEGYTLGRFADDVVRLLDHLGLPDAVLVGHSAGAEIAVATERLHPSRVSALVAIDPAYGLPETDRDRVRDTADRLRAANVNEVVAQYFGRLSADTTDSALRDRRLRSAYQCRPDVARRMFEDINFGPGTLHFRHQTHQAMRHRHAPLLQIYRSDAGATVGATFALRAHDRVLTYPRSGHWPHQEHPDRFARDVREWLNSLPSTDPSGIVADRSNHEHQHD